MKKRLKPKEIFPGVFEIKGNPATKNLNPGNKVYSEPLIEIDKTEYRTWNPNRSKISAAIKKGLKEFPIKEKSQILYLGAAEGTTISHLSDIVGAEGIIYGVDISARSMRKFVYLCEQRPNIVPILADASQPNSYKEHIESFSVDVLTQDVSQKNQAEIFLKNSRIYLKRDGYGLLSIKARSIHSTKPVEELVQEEVKKMQNEFEILQIVSLHPYEKEHAMIYCKKK